MGCLMLSSRAGRPRRVRSDVRELATLAVITVAGGAVVVGLVLVPPDAPTATSADDVGTVPAGSEPDGPARPSPAPDRAGEQLRNDPVVAGPGAAAEDP